MKNLSKLIFSSLIIAIAGIPFVAVPASVPFLRQITDIGLQLALLFWLIRLVFYRTTGFEFLKNGFDKAFLLLAAASLASLPFSHIKTWALGDFASILVGIFSVHLLVSAIKTKKDLITVIQTLALGITFAGIIGLTWAYIKFTPGMKTALFAQPLMFLAEYEHPRRIAGVFITLSGVNVYAAYLISILPLFLTPLFFLFNKISAELKAFGIVLIPVLLANLIFAKSRASFLALFGYLFITAFQFKKWRIMLVGSAAAVMICSLIFVAPIRNALLDIFNTKSTSNIERMMMYSPAIAQIKQRPITGYGDGHSGRNLIRNKKTGQWEQYKNKKKFEELHTKADFEKKAAYYQNLGVVQIQSPHNIFLTVTIETGLLGLAVFLYLFYLLMATTLSVFNSAKDFDLKYIGLGLCGCFSTTIIYGLFHDSLNSRPYALLFWILIALTISLKRLAAQK